MMIMKYDEDQIDDDDDDDDQDYDVDDVVVILMKMIKKFIQWFLSDDDHIDDVKIMMSIILRWF